MPSGWSSLTMVHEQMLQKEKNIVLSETALGTKEDEAFEYTNKKRDMILFLIEV